MIKDKSKGSIFIVYNKKMEIVNSLDKRYIDDYYNNLLKLYCLEVYFNNEEIRDYIIKNRYELLFYFLIDKKFLLRLFGYILNSFIRFEKEEKLIDWVNFLLEGYNNYF